MTWQKWSYMDHWVTQTPQGPQPPLLNRAHMDPSSSNFGPGVPRLRHVLLRPAGPGRDVRLGAGLRAPLAGQRLREDHRHLSAYPYATKYTAPHVAETHDRIVADCERTLQMADGLTGVENFIVMPTSTCFQTEPVTDDTIKVIADLWNRVGSGRSSTA